MNNLLAALQSVGVQLQNSIIGTFEHPTILGFLLGFLISTLVHLLIVVEDPRYLRAVLTKKPESAFTHIHKKNRDEVTEHLYLNFETNYYRARTLFYAAVVLVCGSLFLALLKI
jgi:hypothetical protein